MTKKISHLCRIVLMAAAMLYAMTAAAGNISFQLALTGTTLVVTNSGDSAAYFPAVMRLRGDGHWQPLAPKSGASLTTYLATGDRMEVVWPDDEPHGKLESLQPAMVRFFDEAGTGFGQISFFNTPPASPRMLAARYNDGFLELAAPATGSDIRATWVLWPQEDPIKQLSQPRQAFTHRQPDARYIPWQAQPHRVRLSTGDAQPEVQLLHETTHGYVLQIVAAGLTAGKQQRAAWLDASEFLYVLAIAAVLAALAPMLWRSRRVS